MIFLTWSASHGIPTTALLCTCWRDDLTGRKSGAEEHSKDSRLIHVIYSVFPGLSFLIPPIDAPHRRLSNHLPVPHRPIVLVKYRPSWSSPTLLHPRALLVRRP